MMFSGQLELDVDELLEYGHADVGRTQEIPTIIGSLQIQAQHYTLQSGA